MTRDQLLQLLHRYNIQYRAGTTDEVSLNCPRCSPRHTGHKQTLYINTRTFNYTCFRCEPKNAGREVKSFLRLFKLERYAEQANNQPANEQDLWSTIFGNKNTVTPAANKIELPEGFRTDWHATLTGQAVLRYLKSRLPPGAVRASGAGYIISGQLAGCVVFPITINKDLKFWQARRVIYAREPKYISPPGTKGTVLYGYDWLTGDEATLVEGIFDALNTPNSIALLGKTISDEQIKLLAAKNIRTITVIMDGDAWATTQAVARRVADRLWTVEHVYAGRLPREKDPATANKLEDILTVR